MFAGEAASLQAKGIPLDRGSSPDSPPGSPLVRSAAPVCSAAFSLSPVLHSRWGGMVRRAGATRAAAAAASGSGKTSWRRRKADAAPAGSGSGSRAQATRRGRGRLRRG
eukprot:4153578-Pyramimonas_sp.AAC.1